MIPILSLILICATIATIRVAVWQREIIRLQADMNSCQEEEIASLENQVKLLDVIVATQKLLIDPVTMWETTDD